MRTTALRWAVLVVTAGATLAVGPAAWAEDETFEFTADAARLAADRHTVVLSGSYTCGPLNLQVVSGGGSVELTVRQGRVTGYGYVPVERCDGTAQGYQAEVTTYGEHLFRRGGATLLAGGEIRGERAGELVAVRPSPPRQRITITRG